MSAPLRTKAQDRDPRPIWIALFDAVAVAAFAVAWFALAAQLAQARVGAATLPAMAGALLLGALMADALSGLVHWFADRFFDERAPVLGPLLIQPFREHHRDPTGITHHGFLEVCGNNCAACVLPLGAVWALLPPAESFGSLTSLATACVLSASFFLFATNGFHRWAHTSDPPAWVAWLQRRHLVLSPEQHAAHHRGGHDRAYCVTTGWLNPLIDRLRLFERFERMARAKRRA